MHELNTEGAGNRSLNLFVVLRVESCLQTWVPSKENLGGFGSRFGLVKSSVWLIIWGKVYLLERKVRNSLYLTSLWGCTNSASFIECLLCAQLCASWSKPRRVFGWVAETEKKYHYPVMGICSFKNTNTAHCGGVTDSLERQGSENLLQIQTGEKGCIMRGSGYPIGMCQQIQTRIVERWRGRHLQMGGQFLHLKSHARLP